ncbi:MAG: hypothetical protein LIO85_09055 [Rikenellaceae bacterium]|nr:hypothetical protein [Rikenellaceae bacterium]
MTDGTGQFRPQRWTGWCTVAAGVEVESVAGVMAGIAVIATAVTGEAVVITVA